MDALQHATWDGWIAGSGQTIAYLIEENRAFAALAWWTAMHTHTFRV